jgi:hypothetical protein
VSAELQSAETARQEAKASAVENNVSFLLVRNATQQAVHNILLAQLTIGSSAQFW